MAEDPKKEEEKDKEKDEGEPPKKGGIGTIIGMVLPALLAGGASFGGATFGAANAAPPPVAEEVVPDAGTELPGPSVAMTPFVLSISDEAGGRHAMRLSISVELDPDATEEEFKIFVPRIRDATLTLLREMSFETASRPEAHDEIRAQLLERAHELGAKQATQILLTDFVMQ